MAQLRHAADRFAAAGVSLVAVGMGTPDEARAVVRSLDLPFPVLLDPSRRGYEAYGLIEGGAGAFLSPKSAGAVAKALLGGSRGGRPIGDTRQLGGAFLIDREGIIRWASPSRFAGDQVSPDTILAAAKAVSSGN